MKKIGEYLYELRMGYGGKTLREWCKEHDFSPAEWSALENGNYDIWNAERVVKEYPPLIPSKAKEEPIKEVEDKEREELHNRIDDTLNKLSSTRADMNDCHVYAVLHDFLEQEIYRASKYAEEKGYRRGCMETCDMYFDGEGKEDFLKFWRKNQREKLEVLEDLSLSPKEDEE